LLERNTVAQSFLQIESRSVAPNKFALFEYGFRPFFIAAGLFAIVSILLWMGVTLYAMPLMGSEAVGDLHWHAHEMIYGFSMAVIAGFLLTAVSNWTGVAGFRGTGLMLLTMCWLAARVALLFPSMLAIQLAAMFDTLFLLGLIVVFAWPAFRVRQWKQLGIFAKLLLIFATHFLFYAGVLGVLEQGTTWGIYGGLYVVLGLLFAMVRRVVPFFIQNGVKEDFKARNWVWLDVGSMVLFLLWSILDVFFPEYGSVIAGLSVALVLIHVLRLQGWYTPGIWKAPLLWSLFIGYLFLIAGFVLKAAAIWLGSSEMLALHAFAVGGVGLIGLGMMARVVLGHTGRNVFDPPKIVNPMLVLLAAGSVVRVFLPLLNETHYIWWLAISQSLWLAAFAIFLWLYAPMLVRSRVDGKPG
jgi:uncharacterized protein involved in response to NO